MPVKKVFGLLRTRSALLAVAAMLVGGCDDRSSTGNTGNQAGGSSQARPAAFYVPAEALSVSFYPADPSIEIPFVAQGAISYELPQGTSFNAWLAELKAHLTTLGWYRLTHAIHPTREPVGDAAGWHEGGRETPWMWKEAWANPRESSAIQIVVTTDTPPSEPDGLLPQGTSVSMNYHSGRFVKQRLAEYAEIIEVPWSTTQSAPHDSVD